MIYDLCVKENWLSSSFFQHFFWPLHPHMHSHGEIPDSRPTCLGSLMLSSVVPDTSTLSSFIIEKLCTDFIRSLFLSPLLVWEERKRQTLMFFCSLFSFHLGASGQRVKVEREVLSYPGQTVNLRCAFTDPTGVQLTMVRYTQTHSSLCILLLLYINTPCLKVQ